MKKVLIVSIATILGFASLSAMACPKGHHMVGGHGAHNKGGHCSK